MVTEIYQTIGRGKTDSLFSLLTASLVVFGPRRMDAAASRADALVALGKILDPKAKKHAQLRSGGLAVVASEGGHSAWAFDVVHVDGQPLAVTAVLSNTDDLWAVTAAAIAATPTGRQARSEAAQGRGRSAGRGRRRQDRSGGRRRGRQVQEGLPRPAELG